MASQLPTWIHLPRGQLAMVVRTYNSPALTFRGWSLV